MGSAAADPARVVFQGGTSIPASALILQGTNLVVNAEVEGFTIGQLFPLQTADHVYGDRPAEVTQGMALILMDKPKDALKLLEPSVARQRPTAKISGNFWLEAARGALMAYALTGNSAKCSEIGKEISDATPEPGIDSFVSLGKALLMPEATRTEDRVLALRDLMADDKPANVSACAAYFIGNLFKEDKKPQEALEAYLSVPCLYPTGGLILNAGAEVKSAELLTAMSHPGETEDLLKVRREEALALLKSAQRVSAGTVLTEDINKRLESLK